MGSLQGPFRGIAWENCLGEHRPKQKVDILLVRSISVSDRLFARLSPAAFGTHGWVVCDVGLSFFGLFQQNKSGPAKKELQFPEVWHMVCPSGDGTCTQKSKLYGGLCNVQVVGFDLFLDHQPFRLLLPRLPISASVSPCTHPLFAADLWSFTLPEGLPTRRKSGALRLLEHQHWGMDGRLGAAARIGRLGNDRSNPLGAAGFCHRNGARCHGEDAQLCFLFAIGRTTKREW